MSEILHSHSTNHLGELSPSSKAFISDVKCNIYGKKVSENSSETYTLNELLEYVDIHGKEKFVDLYSAKFIVRPRTFEEVQSNIALRTALKFLKLD